MPDASVIRRSPDLTLPGSAGLPVRAPERSLLRHGPPASRIPLQAPPTSSACRTTAAGALRTTATTPLHRDPNEQMTRRVSVSTLH